MPAFAEKREVQFIALYVIAMLFLGISKETTRFIFPETGEQVYTIINFYFVSIIALMVVISWLAQTHNIPKIPKVPPLWAVGFNFIIFFPLFYIGLIFLFSGQYDIPIPTLSTFIMELAISFNENFMAFILLPALIPFGAGTGTIRKGNIVRVRDYIVKYDIPTIKRMLYGLPSIIIVSFLHVGSYSQNVKTFQEFYLVLLIAFIMFTFMYFIKETFGFGASEAAHAAWNLALIGIRGAVI